MIRPPLIRGAAFGDAGDGNGRDDPIARSVIAGALGIPAEWAYLRQVHGARVIRVDEPGSQGEADAMFSTEANLPMAVATADCYPIVFESERAAGIAHAGWRGVLAGVVPALRVAMTAAGHPPERAAVGPGIGPCCFEVGPEVAGRFPGWERRTDRRTPSVDLLGPIRSQLEGLEVWAADRCTMCDPGYHSYRRDGTRGRQAAVAWRA